MGTAQDEDGTTRGPRVVVGIDGSPGSRDAALVAARSARRRGARLEAVVVVEPPMWSEGWTAASAAAFPLAPFSEVTGRSAAMARALVEDVLAQVRREDGEAPPAGVTALAGDPAHDLYGAADGADELVVGHRGRGRIASLLLGSVGRSAVLHAPCPVTVVPPDGAARTGPVVVGVDGSEDSRAAVAYAAREARRRGVEVRAVVAHQIDEVTWPGTGDLMLFAADLARVEVERARAFVAETLRAVEAAPAMRVTGAPGSPTDVLTDAGREASLLVVGHRGRGAIRGALGSTALGCVLHATGPVTVVPAVGAARDEEARDAARPARETVG